MIIEPLVQNKKLHIFAVFRECTAQLEFPQLLKELNVVYEGEPVPNYAAEHSKEFGAFR